MNNRLLCGVLWICGETIVPERLAGFQLSFNFTERIRNFGGYDMARAKWQVLVIPYFIENETVQYCIFHRSDMDVWQFIAGGGEDEDESAIMSAKREAYEEAGIKMNAAYFQLDTHCSIPASCFKKAQEIWGKEVLVIPEYSFAVMCKDRYIKISHEHKSYEWVGYAEAVKRLKYDSNKTALWELDTRIKRGLYSK